MTSIQVGSEAEIPVLPNVLNRSISTRSGLVFDGDSFLWPKHVLKAQPDYLRSQGKQI
jgi:hypothetical protein